MNDVMQPRLIRNKNAPAYLGMNKNLFKIEARPYLTEIRIGKQGIAFDRLELDRFADYYMRCNGRPALKKMEDKPWGVEDHQASLNGAKSGISTRKSENSDDFVKQLEKVLSRPPKTILKTG